MKSLAKVIDEMAAERNALMTEKQKELRQQFIDLLELWKDGEMGLADITRIIPPYIQFQVFRSVQKSHESWSLMMEFFNAEVERVRGDGIQTVHGFFSREEIESHGGRLVETINEYTDEIERVVEFPTGYGVGIDGKPDRSIPIYGSRMKQRFVEEPFEYREPRGQREWNGET